MNKFTLLGFGLISLALPACEGNCSSADRAGAQPPAAPAAVAAAEKLEPYSCGTVERLHTWKGIFAGSQPAADDLRHAKENGIKTVLNLRPVNEDIGFDESALVGELGMEYRNVAFGSPAELTDEVFEAARAVLRDESKRPVFVHCHSGNRVGAIWAAFRALDGGETWEAALAEAKQVGLKSPALEERARQYVEQARLAGKSG